MLNAKLEINNNNKLLDAYITALKPEQEFNQTRARYTLRKTKNKLIINVKAKDITALRAVINSITGLLVLVNNTWRKCNERKNIKGNSR